MVISSETANSANAHFVRPPWPPLPDPPNPDLQWLETPDGLALTVGPSRYHRRDQGRSPRQLLDALERLADVTDQDPEPFRNFVQQHGALLLCAGCGRQPVFHPGGPRPNTPCVPDSKILVEAREPLVYLWGQSAREHLLDCYRGYARKLRATRWLARALRTHMELAAFRDERSEVLWAEVCRGLPLPVEDLLRLVVRRRAVASLENTRTAVGACLTQWLQWGRSTPVVEWQEGGPRHTLRFHQNVRVNGLGLWEDLAEGLWYETKADSPDWAVCKNADCGHPFQPNPEHRPGPPAKYCERCRDGQVPNRDKVRSYRRRARARAARR